MSTETRGPAEPDVVPVILAGGSGTRLWPASRVSHPKQLLALAGDRSLLQETAARLYGLKECRPYGRLIVVANAEYRFTIAQQLRTLEIDSPLIVLEPAGRNTAPALTLAALLTLGLDGLQENGIDPVLLVMPADHIIQDVGTFQAAVAEGCRLAGTGAVVTFGVVPRRPETNYGYIRVGAIVPAETARHVDGFTEKPDSATAQEYFADDRYLWNSGIFMMRRSVWLSAIARFAPAIREACETACEEVRIDGDFVRVGREGFLASPSDSIDYAVMEPLAAAPEAYRALVISLEAGWSDVGAWDAWWEVADKDATGNAVRGDVVTEGCTDTLIRADHRTVVAVGCKRMAIVESADAILVTPLDEAQEVKKVVARLAEERPEVTRTHRRVFRPWGSYDSVDTGERFQVKHIVVDPGASISLQYHRYRAEHWVVVSGIAEITRGDEVFRLTENQSTHVPIGTVHRLTNPGEVPLEIIEIQSGEYLGEDDIVRIEDAYGREVT